MRTGIIIVIVLLTCGSVKSQTEQWDVYMAQYEKGAGSVMLNMALANVAPMKEFPFIVITGVTARQCNEEGFPTKEEFTNLYTISDGIVATINSVSKNVMAGTFTYQCERLDYIYLKDTLRLRETIVSFYKNKFPDYNYYLRISADNKWEGYLDFLYPNEVIQEYMSNEKVLQQLSASGDRLEKSRPIDHWLYFSSRKDRDSFAKFAEGQKFKIESAEFVKESKRPYQLKISRTGSVDIRTLSELTLELRKKAKEYNGDYDGWETIVMKD